MYSIVLVTAISLTLAILIVLVSAIFKTNTNKLEKELQDMLPGYDCGACGFGSCEGMSKKLAEEKGHLDKCRPITKEQKDEINKILT